MKIKQLFTICIMTFLVFALIGCANNGDAAKSASPDGEQSENPQAEITMEDGKKIRIELDKDAAPITVENFVSLAEEGFYDGLTFHRVVQGFMIQGGDPNGDGTGGPGYEIKGEFEMNGWENPLSHKRGVISMGRKDTGFDTAGCQFFITDADSEFLDGAYAAFGTVVEGMDVVDSIASVETGALDQPLEDVVIKSIKIIG